MKILYVFCQEISYGNKNVRIYIYIISINIIISSNKISALIKIAFLKRLADVRRLQIWP